MNQPKGARVLQERVMSFSTEDRSSERRYLVAPRAARGRDARGLGPEPDRTDHVFSDAQADHGLLFLGKCFGVCCKRAVGFREPSVTTRKRLVTGESKSHGRPCD